jgi:protein CpxP
MTIKHARTLGILAAVAAVGTLGWAQPFRGRGPADGERGAQFRLQRMAKVLELTEAQQEQARSLFEQQRPKAEEARKAMREHQAQVDELMAAPNPDPTAVGDAVIALRQLREQHRADRDSVDEAFKAILTPEQLSKWEVVQAMRPGRGGPHRGARGSRRGWRGGDDE